MMTKKNIAVLGSGPAGLVAAWTALRYGEVDIFSARRSPSQQWGAQYLHGPIPFATPSLAEGVIRSEFLGSARTYRDKIYGPDTVGEDEVSWGKFPAYQEAWDLRRAYGWLWDRLGQSVHQVNVAQAGVVDDLVEDYDAVVSSVPAPVLCLRTSEHAFPGYNIDVVAHPGDVNDNNLVIYDGHEDSKRYRYSQVFGHAHTEYPEGLGPAGSATITKPYTTDCTCHPEVVRVGRYGRWKKGVLVHEVVREVDRALQ